MRRILLLLAVVALSAHAWAFDQNRKGFAIGGGLGASGVFYTQTVESDDARDTSSRENALGVWTDFKIGGGVNERIFVYWTSKVA